jgi:putative exporter of polyketide antibiotics
MLDRLFHATLMVAVAALFGLAIAESMVGMAPRDVPPVVQLERVVIKASRTTQSVAAAQDVGGAQPVVR